MIRAERETIGELQVVSVGPVGGNTVVLCHGFGAPGEDLVGLVEMLPTPERIRYVFPAAPKQLGPMYGGGRAWWEIDFASRQDQLASGEGLDLSGEDPEGLVSARAQFDSLVAALAHGGTSHGELIVGGFSQGAMLALDWALTSKAPVAGVAVLSGTLLASDRWVPQMKDLAAPVFQSHGTMDPVLSFSMAEKLRDELVQAGVRHDFVAFPGQHGIPPEVIRGLGDSIESWLKTASQ